MKIKAISMERTPFPSPSQLPGPGKCMEIHCCPQQPTERLFIANYLFKTCFASFSAENCISQLFNGIAKSLFKGANCS
jgi:hypothetical protein